MTDSKVYIALTHLSIYELNSFKKYLESPYFNMNEKLSLLFDIYAHSIKKESKEEISKEDVWNVIFQGKKYSDSKLRKLNSDLLKVFEEFLAQKTFDNNKFLKNNDVKREELFITTKLWNNSHGYDSALKAIDVSLNNLGLKYVDRKTLRLLLVWN